jgi:tetratricopeptide (TPR) repeat protein
VRRATALATVAALALAPLVARAETGSGSGSGSVPATGSATGAGAASAGAAFEAASKLLLADDLPAARAGFEAAAAMEPQGPWAAQALLEGGAVAERQGDLAGARALYRRVTAEHARHRASRLAEVRLAALEEAGGPGGRWDATAAAHDRLVRAAAADDPAARPAMAALLGQSAGYPRWLQAASWLADASLRAGEPLMAAIWYRRARVAATTAGERFRAGMGEAGLWRAQGELRRARAAYVALEPPDDVAAGARAQAIAAIDRSLAQRAWAWVARATLAVALVLAATALRRRRGSWTGAARALWPPPIEVAYLAPVAAAFIFIAETGNPLAAGAAEVILLGAIGVGWLSGAVLRASDRGGVAGRALHLAIAIAATTALIYLTIIREGLIDLLIETWRAGHDRR